MGTITILLVLNYVPPLGPTNPFYWRHLIYVYTIYVSEKLGLGEREEGGRGKMFTRPWNKRDWKHHDLKTCSNDAHAQ